MKLYYYFTVYYRENMNSQDMIARDITKKQKAVEAQHRQRERLDAGMAGEEGKTTTYAT